MKLIFIHNFSDEFSYSCDQINCVEYESKYALASYILAQAANADLRGSATFDIFEGTENHYKVRDYWPDPNDGDVFIPPIVYTLEEWFAMNERETRY